MRHDKYSSYEAHNKLMNTLVSCKNTLHIKTVRKMVENWWALTDQNNKVNELFLKNVSQMATEKEKRLTANGFNITYS